MLSNNPPIASAVCVTIFSTGGKFQILHVCGYTLLL